MTIYNPICWYQRTQDSKDHRKTTGRVGLGSESPRTHLSTCVMTGSSETQDSMVFHKSVETNLIPDWSKSVCGGSESQMYTAIIYLIQFECSIVIILTVIVCMQMRGLHNNL